MEIPVHCYLPQEKYINADDHMQRDLASVGPAEQHNLESFTTVDVKFLEYDIRALNHCVNASGDAHEMGLLGACAIC